MWENTAPGTELPRDFCARIGPMQLGVVFVFLRSLKQLREPGFGYEKNRAHPCNYVWKNSHIYVEHVH